MLLDEHDLKTYSGCINHITDKNGNHYIIPNYCINDPYFEKEYIIKTNIETKNLKIKLFEPSTNSNITLNVTNLINGEELKKKYYKKLEFLPMTIILDFFLVDRKLKPIIFYINIICKKDIKYKL